MMPWRPSRLVWPALVLALTAMSCRQVNQTAPEELPPEGAEDRSQGTVELELREEPLQAAYAKLGKLKATSLAYRVQFLDETLGPSRLVFKDGVAEVRLTKLPAKRKGTFTLEVLEGDTVRLRGVRRDVTLKPDTVNTLTVDLAPVGVAPQSGDPAGEDGSPPPSQALQWNGREDRGNSRWRIVPAK